MQKTPKRGVENRSDEKPLVYVFKYKHMKKYGKSA